MLDTRYSILAENPERGLSFSQLIPEQVGALKLALFFSIPYRNKQSLRIP